MKPDTQNGIFFFPSKHLALLLLTPFDSWAHRSTPAAVCFSLCLVTVKATFDLLQD